MKKTFDKIEKSGISINDYEEEGKLCGYELNTCTDGGVNVIIFIDFRDTDKDPKNEKDFKDLFSEHVNNIDIDEEIELNRQDKSYKQAFTLTEAVKDFTAYKKRLSKLVKSLKTI
jgi:hypothetical protein